MGNNYFTLSIEFRNSSLFKTFDMNNDTVHMLNSQFEQILLQNSIAFLQLNGQFLLTVYQIEIFGNLLL